MFGWKNNNNDEKARRQAEEAIRQAKRENNAERVAESKRKIKDYESEKAEHKTVLDDCIKDVEKLHNELVQTKHEYDVALGDLKDFYKLKYLRIKKRLDRALNEVKYRCQQIEKCEAIIDSLKTWTGVPENPFQEDAKKLIGKIALAKNALADDMRVTADLDKRCMIDATNDEEFDIEKDFAARMGESAVELPHSASEQDESPLRDSAAKRRNDLLEE